MISVRKIILIPNFKNFDLSHHKDPSHWTNWSNLLVVRMLYLKIFLEEGNFHLNQTLGTFPHMRMSLKTLAT